MTQISHRPKILQAQIIKNSIHSENAWKKIIIIDSSVCIKFPFISFLLEEKLLCITVPEPYRRVNTICGYEQLFSSYFTWPERCDTWQLAYHLDMWSFASHGSMIEDKHLLSHCPHSVFFSTFAIDWRLFVDKSLRMIYK